jgi:hypothetical protein
MMPAHPSPCFIMIHPDFTFRFFEDGLDRPALTAHVGHRAWRDPDWRVTQVILDFSGRRQTAPKDGPHPWPRQAIANGGDAQPREVGAQGAFAAFLNGQTLPVSFVRVY